LDKVKFHISQLTAPNNPKWIRFTRKDEIFKRKNERTHSSSNISRFWTASMEASASTTAGESDFAITTVELVKGLDEDTSDRTNLDEEDEEEEDDCNAVASMQ
jgi:hypothetical protein